MYETDRLFQQIKKDLRLQQVYISKCLNILTRRRKRRLW